MGVWTLGAFGLHHDRTSPDLLSSYSRALPGYTQDDIIGSPFAVTNYTCNPSIGSDTDIANLKKKLNGMGLLLMLDYVPNHSAVDAPWATSNPDYYVRAPKGTQPPYDANTYYTNGLAFGSAGGGGAWPDTIQINIWNPTLRQLRTKELLHVASLSDGIRCDMAYLLLNTPFSQNWGLQLQSWGWQKPSSEWWSDAISAVKAQYPNIIFLAEVYSPYEGQLQQIGFDYTYDKQIRDKLGNGNLEDIRNWIGSNNPRFVTKSCHYISNHDEQRGPSYFGSWWRSDAAALLLYTLPGMRYYWWSDMLGYRYQLDVHLRRQQNDAVVPEVQTLYSSLLKITSDPVFRFGQWTYLNVQQTDTSWRLIAYKWTYNGQKRLCVLNFSDQQGWGNVILSDATPGGNGNDTISVTDLLSGESFPRSAKSLQTSGLTVGVNSWYAQIFQY